MIKNVIIITTAFAAGSTVAYVGGQATAQASIPIVAPYSPDEVQVAGLATDPLYGTATALPAGTT